MKLLLLTPILALLLGCKQTQSPASPAAAVPGGSSVTDHAIAMVVYPDGSRYPAVVHGKLVDDPQAALASVVTEGWMVYGTVTNRPPVPASGGMAILYGRDTPEARERIRKGYHDWDAAVFIMSPDFRQWDDFWASYDGKSSIGETPHLIAITATGRLYLIGGPTGIQPKIQKALVKGEESERPR